MKRPGWKFIFSMKKWWNVKWQWKRKKKVLKVERFMNVHLLYQWHVIMYSSHCENKIYTILYYKNPNIINIGGEVAIIRLFTLSICFIRLSLMIFWFRWRKTYLWTLKYLYICITIHLKKGHFFHSLYGGRGVSNLPIFYFFVFSLFQ